MCQLSLLTFRKLDLMLTKPFKMLVLLTLLVTVFITLFSFQPTKEEYYYNANYIKKAAEEFNKEVILLQKIGRGFQAGTVEKDSLRNAVLTTRLAYKKIEFYLDFQFHEYVNSHINGAPLLHIERTGTSPNVLPPEGLQVLDELAFAENPEEEKTQISSIATKLRNTYGILYSSLANQEINKKELIPVLRLQLVRIFSMGITGFDTPGSLNAIPEAKSALEGMLQFSQENKKLFAKKDFEFIQQKLKNAIIYVEENKNFNEFDRLTFFREYIDPLYKSFGGVKYELPEFLTYTSAWNSESESIFSEDFLNPYFYTELQKEEDSELLKQLGESLFYDPMLSNSGTMSCASCHQPELAFTDGNAKSMSSIQGQTVLRNSPTLLNAVYSDRYFYDLRAYTLEQQAEHVIFNTNEFNTAYSSILDKLNQEKKYQNKFETVFGKPTIQRENLSRALASYVLSLNSFNSDFDKYIRKETNTLNDEAKQGFNLFMGKAACATCHFAPTFSGLVPPYFSDTESEILGVLDKPNKIELDKDKGRIANKIESEEAWIFEKSFKTTTIRNSALTAPYFHNGAYATLEEVVEFYNLGGGEGQGVEVKNQTLSPDPLDLTEKEKQLIISFLKSTTDISSAIK
ncbi:cytochrome c peroxidase [Mesonia phycicola]|uniref:Cytochrome c peroxidase n=1 Tax=Mesonia phycicola TaxID=579105 RepID=A0A1M6FNM4_9FLAO|nr:cytochrome c peroxidase [Mesonia phycicola]SHI99253.1 cytochrome c peroxidase [Mesonia phycicola]